MATVCEREQRAPLRTRPVSGLREVAAWAAPTAVLWLLIAGILGAAEKPPRRPNILWIIAENISLDLGCYGEPLVSTPNVDWLSATGVRFTRVYATSPVCAPSRSALMTGMYQTTIDCHHMRSHRNDDYRLPEGVRPLTHRLQEAGYFTANVRRIGDKLVGTGKLDLNFVNEGPIFQSESWEEAIKHQPFYIQVNLPEVEYDIYDRKTRFKKRVKWVGEDRHPKVATPESVRIPPYYPDHPIVRQEWARYLNSVSGLDVRVGWILDALRRENLLERTVIFFFADNGRLEPRGIHYCYRQGLHVPLIVRWPRDFPPPPGYKRGSTDERLVSLLDLTATTLKVAGIDRPLTMHSRDFLFDRSGPGRKFLFSARDRIDETVLRMRSVYDGRYHYIRNFTPDRPLFALNRYKEKCFLILQVMRRLHGQGLLEGPPRALMADRMPPEELYDTVRDPHEIRNLAGSNDPRIRAVLDRMRTALEVWMVETGDRGHIPEPPEVIAAQEREMEEWFGTPEWVKRAR